MTSLSPAVSLWLRRLAWGLAGLLVLWVLAWAAVPPLLKSQAQSRLSALLGRQVTVGGVEFSPWSLELTVRDLAVATADGKSPQFSVDRVYVDAELQSLLRLAPVVDAVAIDGPKVHLTHLGAGQYDIDDIVQRLNTPDDTPTGPTPRFAVYNVTLTGGSVDYLDQAGGGERRHTVRDLQISLPFLSSFDSKRDVLVSPRLALVLNGSKFDTAAQGTPFAQTRKGEADITIQQLDLAPYLPYLPAGLPVKPQSAVVDAALKIGFVQNPQTAVTLSGSVTVSRIAVQDAAGKPLLSADSLQVGLADVRPLERSVKLSTVELKAPQLNVVQSADGKLNLLPASAAKKDVPKKIAAPADTASASGTKDTQAAAASAAWSVQLDTLALRDAAMDWTDQTTAPATRLGLREANATVSHVQWPMTEAASLDFKARLQSLASGAAKVPAATLSLQGEGTVASGKAALSVSDFGLGLVSGYVAPYLVPTVRGQADTQLSVAWDGERQTAVVQKLALRDVALVGAPAAPGTAATPAATANAAGNASSGDMPQFKLLEVSDVRLDTLARTATVGKVLLQKPSSGVRRDADGHWMFESWLKPTETTAATPLAGASATKPATAQAGPSKSPLPWKLNVGEFKLDDGNLVFSDRVPARPVRVELSGLQVQAKNIQPDGKKPMPLQVAGKLKSGQVAAGSLRYTGSVMWDPVVAQGDVELVDVPAHAFAPYASGALNLDVLRADTSFKGQVRYAALAAGPEVSLKGDAALEDFKANTTGNGAESLGEELLSWKALNVPGIDFSMSPGAATKVQVREAALSDFYARLIVSPDGRLNLQDVSKPTNAAPANAADAAKPVTAAASSPAPVQAAAPAAVIQMGPISLVNGRVLFSDRFIKPNYTANLTDLTGKLSRFSNQPTGGVVQLADLELRGRAEGTASLEILGKLNPLAQPLALDITGLVRDLELSPLSPYAVKYAGYGIERGKLSVDVRYTVQPDGQLTASNKLVLNQLTFGDKVEGAPASLPVKLAVALLADRNGVIDLDLPISGSLNDPQFRIGPVIWKVITNLVTKAITAPFSLLANAFGGSGGAELSSVTFAPGSATLSDGARAGLDKVAQALQDRSALKLTVVGSANLEAEREAAKREKLKALLVAEKRRVASAQGKDAATVSSYTAEEMPALLRAVYRRADITKPRNLVGLTKDIPVADMEALLLANLSANEDDIRDLALQRAVAVKEYLAGKKLPTERLFLGAVKTGGPAADAKPQAELEIGGH